MPARICCFSENTLQVHGSKWRERDVVSSSLQTNTNMQEHERLRGEWGCETVRFSYEGRHDSDNASLTLDGKGGFKLHISFKDPTSWPYPHWEEYHIVGTIDERQEDKELIQEFNVGSMTWTRKVQDDLFPFIDTNKFVLREGAVEEPEITSFTEITVPKGFHKLVGRAVEPLGKMEIEVTLFKRLWSATLDGTDYTKGGISVKFALERKEGGEGWFSFIRNLL